MLGSLTAGIGHELRNLLMPILLRIDVLTTRAELSKEALDDIDRIRGGVARLHSLADTLHLLSVDPFDHPGGSTDVNACGLSEQLRTLAQAALPGQAVVHMDMPADVGAVRIPPAVLAQAILCTLTQLGSTMSRTAFHRLTISVRGSADLVVAEFSLNVDGHEAGQAHVTQAPHHAHALGVPDADIAMALTGALLERYGCTIRSDARDAPSRVFILTMPRARPSPHAPSHRVRVHIAEPRQLAAVRHMLREADLHEVVDEAQPVELIICDLHHLDSLRANARTHEGSDESPRIVVVGARPAAFAHPGFEFVDLSNAAQLTQLLRQHSGRGVEHA